MTRDCSCPRCVRCCTVIPGWFAPDEVQKAADLLRLPLKTFVERYLTIATGGWQEDGDEPMPVLRPRRVEHDPPFGEIFWDNDSKYDPHTPCVFLKNERCRIHEAKPIECRTALACQGKRTHGLRDKLEKEWAKSNLIQQIKDMKP